MSNKQDEVKGRCSCGQAATLTATAAVEVMAENVTLRISRLCWRRGQQPDGVVWSQSGLSESGEGAGTHVILCGLEWGAFLSAKGKTRPVYHVAAMSIFRFNITPSLDTVFFPPVVAKRKPVSLAICLLRWAIFSKASALMDLLLRGEKEGIRYGKNHVVGACYFPLWHHRMLVWKSLCINEYGELIRYLMIDMAHVAVGGVSENWIFVLYWAFELLFAHISKSCIKIPSGGGCGEKEGRYSNREKTAFYLARRPKWRSGVRRTAFLFLSEDRPEAKGSAVHPIFLPVCVGNKCTTIPVTQTHAQALKDEPRMAIKHW